MIANVLLIGSVIITSIAARCAGCGREAMCWRNVGGRTRCVSCSPEAKS